MHLVFRLTNRQFTKNLKIILNLKKIVIAYCHPLLPDNYEISLKWLHQLREKLGLIHLWRPHRGGRWGGGGGWRKRAQNLDECECFIRDGGLFNKMCGRPQVKKINNHKSKIFKILIAGSISISDSFSGNIPPCEESDNFKEKW